MSGNTIQVGDLDSAVRIKDDGIVVAGASDPCCCDNPDVVCGAHTFKTYYDVTISGFGSGFNLANGVLRVTFQTGACTLNPKICWTSVPDCWWQACLGPYTIYDIFGSPTEFNYYLSVNLVFDSTSTTNFFVEIRVDDLCIGSGFDTITHKRLHADGITGNYTVETYTEEANVQYSSDGSEEWSHGNIAGESPTISVASP